MIKIELAVPSGSSAESRPRERIRTHILLSDLAQIYPSSDGLLKGCGEAHMYALRELSVQRSHKSAELATRLKKSRL